MIKIKMMVEEDNILKEIRRNTIERKK